MLGVGRKAGQLTPVSCKISNRFDTGRVSAMILISEALFVLAFWVGTVSLGLIVYTLLKDRSKLKRWVAVLTVCLVVFAAAWPSATRTGPAGPFGNMVPWSAFVPKTSAKWQSLQVYITRTGHKYHRAGCRYLSKSCIPLMLVQADRMGYEPCSVCNPPRLSR